MDFSNYVRDFLWVSMGFSSCSSSSSRSRRKKQLIKISFSMGFRNYVRNFWVAILRPLRPVDGTKPAAGSRQPADSR